MKIFVFAYDRYDSITTSPMLESEGIDHTVLCHTQEHANNFINAGRVNPARIIMTGEPAGLSNNRNAALEMMNDGEWAMFLVDDFKKVTELDGYDSTYEEVLDIDMTNQNMWRKRFKKEISMREFVQRNTETARYAERLGSNLIGFAGIDNALFRRKKWAVNVLADGRSWAVRKTHLRFDTNVQLIDDLCWTALNIQEFGTVVVNQWILPDCKRYTKGSFGSINDRMPQKMKEAKYLVDTYPHLITFKKKAGWPEGSHVALRPHRPIRSQ